MSTDPRRRDRGFTLVEVFSALAVLAIATLGLTAGIVVALRANGLAAQRTLMLQFAQARLERLVAETRVKIPTATTTTPDCSAMTVAGAFNPNVAPGTGGWMLDVIDGAAPGAQAGDDAMFGPVLIFDAATNATDNYIAATRATRTAVYNAWTGGGLSGGCGASTLAVTAGGAAGTPGTPAILCREVHVEPQTVNAVPMLRAWVRVLQVGTDWQVNSVTLTVDISQ